MGNETNIVAYILNHQSTDFFGFPISNVHEMHRAVVNLSILVSLPCKVVDEKLQNYIANAVLSLYTA